MQLKPGDTIGEYEILEVIGNGGFSVVYRAEDTNLLRPVAIKQLSPEAFSEAGTREWFIREARLSASLNHPNIVATFALREQGDSIFLVMEYLSGGDLHNLVSERGPLDRATLLRVASNVCHALETLHARNVIHRDIKPENILIAQEGHFKLADFGLAHVRQARHDGLNRASGPQPGTLLYMSPEQALGKKVTARSDLYSLAAVLYEAMTGSYYLDVDLEADDDETVLAAIIEAEPAPPRHRHESIPAEIDDPLMRALSKDPAQRPATAREFHSALKAVLARGKNASNTPRRRTSAGRSEAPSPELFRELSAIRKLRDADHRAEEAQARLREWWEAYSEVPEVAAEWGETLVVLGYVEQGREWLERAAQQKPDLPFAQLALAAIYRDVDRDGRAAQDAVLQALYSDPDLVYAILYEELTDSAEEHDVYEALVELFRQAATERPTPAILHNLGMVLALNDAHVDESLEAFHSAIERDPDYGPAYVGLGSLLIEMDQLDEALPYLEHAPYRAFPQVPPYDWHRAKTVYQRPHAYLALALAYAQAGQLENSAVAACTVLDLDPAELEEDAGDLLDIFVDAVEGWIEAGQHLRAYKLLNQLIPLAAHWADVRIFTLLEITEKVVSQEYRRSRQWDDAQDWLEASLLDLRRSSAGASE